MKLEAVLKKLPDFLAVYPDAGARPLAKWAGCNRDTARKALAIHRAPTNYDGERLGFLDIESSNLKATFGIVLSYCILGSDGKMIANAIRPAEIRSGAWDRRLVEDCCRDVRKYTRLVTWYGSRFDIPFLRTRAIKHGLDFPVFQEVLHTDALFISRHRLKMHSNRLEAVCEFLGIPAKGHKLNPEVWLKCMSGDRKALAFVLAHNREDVESLKAVWQRIFQYAQKQNRSI